MSQAVFKALQFMDKKDLECAICLNRFHQPKTLKCMHTYCLQCIQKWVETHGKMKCPTCAQEHDLTRYDLKELASNTMIIQLLEYVVKTEDQKPSKCSCCDINPPEYHCQTCQLYLCGGLCIKQHHIIPSLRNHSLYTLDKKEQGRISDKQSKCRVHCNNLLEFFCSTCNKSACKHCEHILRCYQKQHKVIPMSTAINEFNNDATEIVKLAHEIESKLKEKLEYVTKYRSEIDSQQNFCRTAIEIQEKKLINTVTEKSKELISDVEAIYKEEKEDIDSKVNDIDLEMSTVNNLMALINRNLNKPEETETLQLCKTTINTVREKVLRKDFHQSLKKRNITPNFIPFTYLDELMVLEGIGKITTVDSMLYKVAQDDEALTVTKEQPFVVKVSSPTESDACQLAATLINPSGQKYGEYKITGRCNIEGNWQMKITTGAAHIKGSPVNIKVESQGLVYTIGNISDYKENQKESYVSDLVLDTDGCILVSSFSKYILKFNQSGSFVDGLQVPQDVDINRMHLMFDGHMVFSDHKNKCVVMCDDTFQEIISFGKAVLKYPDGLTVNNETRILYVADRDTHCVFKFNVDDGRQLGKIGSKGSKVGQMNTPDDVTLTKEGYVIVADRKNNRIQMFDANDKFMRILVGCGEEDGKVISPHGVIIDMDENIIVSSDHKLQLFNRSSVFIKRIDHKDDGLDIPNGITVISNKPRRVAVANHKPNNVKFYNY
ncbi:E3 ubiquitin-protein ligase TRIM71-like [Anneissia japonica]|uniref:E3 ubiquitin-protein ligase TRIM71-like n=1 Tax=Anneissia japonica TaxID=1529436 RepID=UPI00142586CE|nr:E3 ubiquitin-protein ligase TRIM71-like [Anneissia japonica]XP_033123799.1 E3 ubiquitin-protein ligase TRIM71-like [Anneissia japonica]